MLPDNKTLLKTVIMRLKAAQEEKYVYAHALALQYTEAALESVIRAPLAEDKPFRVNGQLPGADAT